MNDERLIRLSNFQRLCETWQLTATELVNRLGSRYSFWRDLLADEKPSFGEKLARRIEEGLLLPRGWLDQADAQIPQETSASPTLFADTLVIADLLRKAPVEDRHAWIAGMQRDLKRSAAEYSPDDLARFEAALRHLDEAGGEPQ
jgi:hypothetical protein